MKKKINLQDVVDLVFVNYDHFLNKLKIWHIVQKTDF